jgi:acetylornithine/succinyldiaminopimelate/putrescine aminotransferase
MQEIQTSGTNSNEILSQLAELRDNSGTRQTLGIPDDTILDFAAVDSTLRIAITEAVNKQRSLQQSFASALMMSEAELIPALQSDFVNFYPSATINPYITLAAKGPWIVTSHGAVVHDSGGYGMLGFGHGPTDIIGAMSENSVMANIMSPNFSHLKLTAALKKELGHTRVSCPFSKFICMNSGSESVTVASRISDVNTKLVTADGGRHAGKRSVLMSLTGSFHGRTDRPAQVSDSCLGSYREKLASFATRDNLITVPPNDVAALEAAFAQADTDGLFIESLFVEPVMGEGNPGACISREFYDAARRITKANGTIFLVDSIQAGLRGQGCLSIVDYPGFEDAEGPDMETFSKALNAGQYPLSVLAMNDFAADLYKVGIYGNTMTGNPRALEVACAVLGKVTPALRVNIRERGLEFVEKLTALMNELGDGIILGVQGTGLLLAAELDPERYPVIGFDGVETRCRKAGFGVIHGGKNALRLTPHFGITSKEIDLIVGIIRDVLKSY